MKNGELGLSSVHSVRLGPRARGEQWLCACAGLGRGHRQAGGGGSFRETQGSFIPPLAARPLDAKR